MLARLLIIAKAIWSNPVGRQVVTLGLQYVGSLVVNKLKKLNSKEKNDGRKK